MKKRIFIGYLKAADGKLVESTIIDSDEVDSLEEAADVMSGLLFLNSDAVKFEVGEYHQLDTQGYFRIRACKECGGRKVQGTTWIELNTGKAVGDTPPLDDTYYCPDCDTLGVEVEYV